MTVCLWTKWLCIQIMLLSLRLQIWHLLWARSFLIFRQTIECRCSLNLVQDMIIIYSQMHCKDKYSEHSSVIWPVWLNGWVFLYKLSGCGCESHSFKNKLDYCLFVSHSNPENAFKHTTFFSTFCLFLYF